MGPIRQCPRWRPHRCHHRLLPSNSANRCITFQEISIAHASWQPILDEGLCAIERDWPGYLSQLAEADFLPCQSSNYLRPFRKPIDQIKYVLVGEGPYPRTESANGNCFMDAAVGSLWATENKGGLSKTVNRATSLRNFFENADGC